MDEYQDSSHSKWECKYHGERIPKCRRKTLYAQLQQHLGGGRQIRRGPRRSYCPHRAGALAHPRALDPGAAGRRRRERPHPVRIRRHGATAIREDPRRVPRLREGWAMSRSAGHSWSAAGQVVRFLRFGRKPAYCIGLGVPTVHEAVELPWSMLTETDPFPALSWPCSSTDSVLPKMGLRDRSQAMDDGCRILR